MRKDLSDRRKPKITVSKSDFERLTNSRRPSPSVALTPPMNCWLNSTGRAWFPAWFPMDGRQRTWSR